MGDGLEVDQHSRVRIVEVNRTDDHRGSRYNWAPAGAPGGGYVRRVLVGSTY